MSKYLNHNATLQCTHGGQVMMIPPPMRSLYIVESPVVTDVDLYEAMIIGCPQIGPGIKPCLKIVAILMGEAIQIEVDGETPILSSLEAMTDGVPPGMVSAITDGGSNAEPAPFSIMAMTMAAASAIGAALCPPCIGSGSPASSSVAGTGASPAALGAAAAAGLAGMGGVAPNQMAAGSAPPGASLPQLLHAREMAKLADNVYQDSGAPPGYTRLSDDPNNLPPGLRDLPFHDPQSGFDAAIYKTPEGNIAVAYRGTESKQDWITNLKQGAGFQTDQYDEAVRMAQRVQASYPDENIEITGHSLGGGLAQAASAATGIQATTFNAAGVNSKTYDRYDTGRADVNATNYTVDGEVLTSVQDYKYSPLPTAAGQQVPLEARNPDGTPINAGPIGLHKMDSVEKSLDYAISQAGQK